MLKLNFLFKFAAKTTTMKIKQLLKISSALMVMALFLSSCNSTLQVSKKRHSNGYYVNIGGGNYESQAKPVQKLALSNGSEKTENNIVAESIKAENTQVAALTNNTTKVSKTELQTLSKEAVVNHATSSKKASGKKSNKISNIKKAVEIKNAIKASKGSTSDSDVMLIILVILAIIIPPLAVYLVKDISTPFWINLILALIGWGVGFALLGGALAWLGGLAAIIHALLIVLGKI